MISRCLSFMAMVCLLVVTLSSIAAEKPASGVSKAQAKSWDDAWSWGNALVVKNYFDQVYYPHAAALLAAEKQLASGAKSAEVVTGLKSLPGIRGVVVISAAKGGDAQWPDSLVKLDALNSILLNSATAQKPVTISPMTHRTVGGLVKFQHVPMGDRFLDLMVRYFRKDSLSTIPQAAICLIMDPKWLTAQIPSAMDSLYRENSQLLFCAASPTNHLWEQSLGVITGQDTLWWIGRKDVKVTNIQPIWPFPGIDIHSYVHSIEKK